MTQKKVLRQLLNTDNEYSANIRLLKKIMLTAYMGRLRINDQAPDRKFSLSDYLFDEERTVLDFTRLSDEKLQKFRQWLLDDHQKEKTAVVLSNVGTNEYRGFSAEVALSWWGQLINWLFNKIQDQWQLADLVISMDYQLLALEICEGKKGMLLGFQQLLAASMPDKYADSANIEEEATGNTKRVYLSDAIVDKLLSTSIHDLDFAKIGDQPHPQAVTVKNPANRFKAMQEYRQIQQFNYKPWYIELLDWVISWFVTEEKPTMISDDVQNTIEPLLQEEGVWIYKRADTEEIVVIEPRPDINAMVYCGGGAKMFADVGVMQALEEAQIYPTRFAGSSAGAFISLLGYLGYKSQEVLAFLKQFKPENLINYDIDRKGLSNSTGLKAAVDFMIAKKVDEISKKYKIRHPEGPITFNVLDSLRERCPGCGIGEELVVTATHIRESQTRYFSLLRTPNKEVSEVVTASASLPFIYRPMLIEGEAGLEEHLDGGMLNNFPTEAFSDDHSTFLEAENGNNLKVLAVQFDNGTERSTIDNIMQRVYKENALLNGFYRLVTGINDPASGWEQDRIKLRQHAMQSVIVDVGNVGTAAFNITETEKNTLVENGYSAAKKYIETRHIMTDEGAKNDELMYSTFSSLADLLSWCCYRNQKKWFDRVYKLVEASSDSDKKALLTQANLLRELYFSDNLNEDRSASHGFFGRTFSATLPKVALHKAHYDHFRTLYPLCLAMSHDYIQLKDSKAMFEKILHSFNLQSPLYGLGDALAKIPGKTHILFHITVTLLQKLNAETSAEIYEIIEDLTEIYKKNTNIHLSQFFGHWNLSQEESAELLDLFRARNTGAAKEYCELLQAKHLPLEKEWIKPSPKEQVLPIHLMGRVLL